jgi:hypothetical protein
MLFATILMDDNQLKKTIITKARGREIAEDIPTVLHDSVCRPPYTFFNTPFNNFIYNLHNTHATRFCMGLVTGFVVTNVYRNRGKNWFPYTLAGAVITGALFAAETKAKELRSMEEHYAKIHNVELLD